MLLTITTTHKPATDLGYLLHKNPSNPQSFEMSFGTAHVYYPVANEKVCTAALMLEVNPIDLIRGKSRLRQQQYSLGHYVNDRPYASSSFMSVAIGKVFGTAMTGRSKDRPELAAKEIPLEISITSLPSEAGVELIEKIFSPLGYDIQIEKQPLDENFPDWGESKYYQLNMETISKLSEILNHLYVLIPVLDNHKHYWVDKTEIDKLMRKGENWLKDHPAKELIVARYLSYKRSWTREALTRLLDEDIDALDEERERKEREESQIEKSIGLHEQRLGTVLSLLKSVGAKRVLDLGCGEGKLLNKCLEDGSFSKMVGMDVSHRSLEKAKRRLRYNRLPEKQKEKIELIHGSLMYKDDRLKNHDVACLIEVIEHMDPPRLEALELSVFKYARPVNIIITTPNVEYNVHFENVKVGKFRHRDHRFEWTREEFQEWALKLASGFDYEVRFMGIGTEIPETGAPTQLAHFSKKGGA